MSFYSNFTGTDVKVKTGHSIGPSPCTPRTVTNLVITSSVPQTVAFPFLNRGPTLHLGSTVLRLKGRRDSILGLWVD